MKKMIYCCEGNAMAYEADSTSSGSTAERDGDVMQRSSDVLHETSPSDLMAYLSSPIVIVDRNIISQASWLLRHQLRTAYQDYELALASFT